MSPVFQRIVEDVCEAHLTDDKAFCDIIERCLEVFHLGFLADSLGASKGSVNSWANGVSAPTEAMKGVYYRRLLAALTTEADE